MRAVRAGHRGVFDDGDRRVVLAERPVAERRRHQQLGHGHALGGGRLRLIKAPKLPSAASDGDVLARDEQFRRVITWKLRA